MSPHGDAKSRGGGGIFDGLREVLRGSGHAAVDGDRVADNVDADLYGINTESKHYWPYEADLFHAAYDGTLSRGRSKGSVEEHGDGEGQGDVGKREGEGKRRSILDLVMRLQMGEKLLL